MKNANRSSLSDKTGAALLVVLVIVAALSATSVAVLEGTQRNLRLSSNATSLAQAQWYAMGADAYVKAIAADLQSGPAARAAFADGPRTFTFPLDYGLMEIEARDGSTCINLNSVVAGANDIFQRHETGAAQFAALLEALRISDAQADDLDQALVDWIDTDDGRRGSSSDDTPYLRQTPTYMTGREPLVEVSELRAIRGFTPQIYETIRPYVCALPLVGPTKVNVNALSEDDAPVLSAMTQGAIDVASARRIIATRPASGWTSPDDLWGRAEFSGMDLPEGLLQQTALEAQFLDLSVNVTHLDAEASLSEQLMLSGDQFVTTARRWSEDP
ncbi:MAG: type II secretion system minor pseudopilin GspK [Hyphomonadaceae bacterium]